MKLILYTFIVGLVFSCYSQKTLNSEYNSVEEIRSGDIKGEYVGIFPYLYYKNEISDSSNYQFTLETNKNETITVKQFYNDSLIGSLQESFKEYKEVLKIKTNKKLDFNFIINTYSSSKIQISQLDNKTINVQYSNGGTMFFLIFPFMAANNGEHNYKYFKTSTL